LELDENGDLEVPFQSTAAAVCSKTLKQIYTPRTGASPYPAHKQTYGLGVNTILVTPFCVHGQKFAGCINAYMEEEDGFSETDRILLQDVASMLGASVYNKRLKFAADCSNKVSREILHSMIPLTCTLLSSSHLNLKFRSLKRLNATGMCTQMNTKVDAAAVLSLH
jgi:hypothetical protein